MNENFRSIKAREFFTHKWKPNNQEFCFELRKKKRVQDLNRRRFSKISSIPEQFNLSSNDLTMLEMKIKENEETSGENFPKGLEELLNLSSRLFFLNFENFSRIFDLVVDNLEGQSPETIENRIEFLSSLLLKVNSPHEDELIISKKIFASLFEDSTFFNDLFFKFLLLLVQNKRLKMLKEYCDFLDEVKNTGSGYRKKWVVIVVLELSKNHSICEYLPSGLFKLVLDGIVSNDEELQASSLSIIENISAGPDASKLYLIEIGVVNILSSLLVIGSTSIQKHSLASLTNLFQTDTLEIITSILSHSLVSSIFYTIQTKFVGLASSLSKFLYSMTEKSILLNLEILPLLTDANLFPTLCQTLSQDSLHLTTDFLNFLDNILYLSTNSLKLQDFIESGCYFALEHCSLRSTEELSTHLDYILKSYFEQ
jgi:hypothetical protein